MHHHHDLLVTGDPERRRRDRIEYPLIRNHLDFEIVIAGSQGSQLVHTSGHRMVGHSRRIGPLDTSPFFHAGEIPMPSISLFHTPFGPMGHHPSEFFLRETNEPAGSDASGHFPKEFSHEPL